MSKPEIAKAGPYIVDVEPGTYYWCSCGKSKSQPFCDGSHAGTDFAPFEIELFDESGVTVQDPVEIIPDRFGNYNFLFEQLKAGGYVAVITDDSGCSLTLSQIDIEYIDNDVAVIPNVFTPNNDSYNEAFIILNKKANTKLVIVNRWGVKVFSSDDYQNNWAAEGVPDGIYFYTISMDGQVYNGSVEVWRGGAKINN